MLRLPYFLTHLLLQLALLDQLYFLGHFFLSLGGIGTMRVHEHFGRKATSDSWVKTIMTAPGAPLGPAGTHSELNVFNPCPLQVRVSCARRLVNGCLPSGRRAGVEHCLALAGVEVPKNSSFQLLNLVAHDIFLAELVPYAFGVHDEGKLLSLGHLIAGDYITMNVPQDDTMDGTVIVPVRPQDSPPKKSKKKAHRKKKAKEGLQQQEENSMHALPNEKEREQHSEGKFRGVDEQTMGGQLEQSGLSQPYQFLSQRSPSIFSIFFPRFRVRSLTFWLSIIYIVMFVVLLAYNYSRTQTDLTWNCSLFLLQNKYAPKLQYGNQLWRVLASAFFHSNIAHFCLDLFALQIYGYFIEWHYGAIRYLVTFLIAMVYSHFMSAALQTTTLSTTPSAFLMAVVALKIVFFWEYREYRRLRQRRMFLYILMALLVAINLIPIFVVNNVDYSAHLAGVIVGAALGIFFLLGRTEESSTCMNVVRIAAPVLLIATFALFLALVFTNGDGELELLAGEIDSKCAQN